VIPDRLDAQVELGGDLFCRAPLLEKTKHLDLSGRSSISPKTPTTRSPFLSGTELTSTATRVPAVETKTPVASVAWAVPSTFWENSSRARLLSSGVTMEV
jgi:hypothetical protein